jgi:hypothetical protein
MDALLLSDFRSFRGNIDVPLRPLTLLVGENSGGKSSFLAAARLAWDTVFQPHSPRFNEPPFELGAYPHIASAWPSALARSFQIGCRVGEVEHRATYSESEGQPALTGWSVKIPSASIQTRLVRRMSGRSTWKTDLAADGLEVSSSVRADDPAERAWNNWVLSPTILSSRSWAGSGTRQVDNATFRAIESELRAFTSSLVRPVGFSAVQRVPSRTEDPVHGENRESLAWTQMLAERLTLSAHRRDFTKELQAFGEDAGLFSSVKLNRLPADGNRGQHAADPFQVLVEVRGNLRNLVDVGYGVSQILPIAITIIEAEDRSPIWLIQQPEGHLHPQAQAAFGTFLTRMVAKNGHRVLVETHSDFLIDRVRMEVRDRTIRPEDVQILHFQPNQRGTRIHQVTIDTIGNVQNAPAGYRRFFLDELGRSLGA